MCKLLMAVEQCTFERGRGYRHSGRAGLWRKAPEVPNFIHPSFPPFLDLGEGRASGLISTTQDLLPTQEAPQDRTSRLHHPLEVVLPYCGLWCAIPVLSLPGLRGTGSSAPACFAIPHGSQLYRAGEGGRGGPGSQARHTDTCTLTNRLRATGHAA